MIKKLQLCLVSILLILFSFPLLANAEVYGGGSYGSCAMGSSCNSTNATAATTSVPDSTDTTTTPNPNQTTLTISANGQELKPNDEFTIGDPIVFSGVTTPFAEVHLYFQSEPFEAIVNADKDGYWSYTLTKDLGVGKHTLQIAVRNPDTEILSEKSEPNTFILSAAVKAAAPATQTANYWWIYVVVTLVAGALLALAIWVVKKRHSLFK